ncbi:MAG: MTH1187 family thiamine-binding protein [Macrococcus canis]|uniref:MTH1187 family thiamine-binding protein n=1 Tax=Macrococcoides canis TaxID=1855823 RepID=UPI00105EBB68|nr:MTH1187 family thiamine-binding protein [Macrococcus canis]MEE1106686.1 MTH1187 family thiamine-binding protein [Macrococcus canis]TDM23561.1 MTH1187 family thiamine-binding protein [Macrococcus canis]TDM31706.1 MTH1187 family thiamine-binding protein [Macrococcus canis]TDM43189.1 MTH1187 family thiamine-binding protein [Macrococcus canis]
MAIIDVVIIPIDGKSIGISKYVAEVQNILQEMKQEGKIDYQLTPMSTLIEGELNDCLAALERIHESPFQVGVERVCTNIRIDDRRDKQRKMNDKLDSVKKHMH